MRNPFYLAPLQMYRMKRVEDIRRAIRDCLELSAGAALHPKSRMGQQSGNGDTRHECNIEPRRSTDVNDNGPKASAGGERRRAPLPQRPPSAGRDKRQDVG